MWADQFHSYWQFQSLFYWNCRLIDRRRGITQEELEFQSLFYWNCRLIPTIRYSSGSSHLSFNPCFIGIAVWSPWGCGGNRRELLVSILVLLELPFDQQSGRSRWSRPRSFNPCFIGIAVWSPHGSWCVAGELSSFNPCFIGIAVWSSEDLKWDTKKVKFQSLFYWNCRLILPTQRISEGAR